MLHVLKPVKFSTSMLDSTNAVDVEIPWTPASYSIGAVRTHPDSTGLSRVWQSLLNSNTSEPGTDASKWLLYKTANTVAMFDERTASQTVVTGSLVVVFQPLTTLTTVAALNIKGNSIKLEVLESGIPIHTQTINLRRTTVYDWFTYFTAPFEYLTRAVFYNVPAYYSSYIRITVDGVPAGTTAIGNLVFGHLAELGYVKYGAGSGIIDYSVKRKDETFGDAVFVERDFADENTFSISVPKSRSNFVKTTLRELRATPCLWIGSDEEVYSESLITFGWYRNHTLVAQYFDESLLDIEIEGLT